LSSRKIAARRLAGDAGGTAADISGHDVSTSASAPPLMPPPASATSGGPARGLLPAMARVLLSRPRITAPTAVVWKSCAGILEFDEYD
jgi:hypothetical protein